VDGRSVTKNSINGPIIQQSLVVKTFQKLKGRVILVNPQEQVKSMFVEMNVGKVIPMYKTDESYSQFSEV
jgi:hypothetical protein